jgi:uncharacterized alpha-E superfamily protein
LSPDRILEFLLLNRDFPHAIRYCVDGIRHAIESIQRTGGRRPRRTHRGHRPPARHARLHHHRRNPGRRHRPAFLHTIREQCLRIHELIYRYYVHYSIQSALAV